MNIYINQKKVKRRNFKNKKIPREIINKRQKKLFNLFHKKTQKYVLYNLKKWKERAFRIKIKNKTKEAYKYKVKTKTNIKDYNVKITHNAHRNKKDVNKTTFQKTIVKSRPINPINYDYSYNYVYNKNYYQTKTYNTTTTSKRSTINKMKAINECPVHGRKPCPIYRRNGNIRLYHRPISSPYIYTSTTIDTKKREAHYSPHVYSRRTYNNNSYFDIYENYKNNNYDSYLDKSYENNYNYSYKLNKSFDAGYYKKDKEKIKYTTIDERTNHKVFNRV